MDIDEFIAARLHEREQKALQSGDGRWRLDGDVGCYTECRIDSDDMIIYDEGGHTRQQAEHIILNDPAHVRREVAAKRQILDALPPLEEIERCWAAADPGHHQLYELAMLVRRSFAAVDDGHPDYNPEWSLT